MAFEWFKRQRTDSGPAMPRRVLGKTGVELPILGFGTAASGQRLNVKQAVQLYEAAYLEGITYFDTAPEFAGYGQAQIQLSHVLKHVRRQIFLVTKCFEADGERALQLLDRSLRELGTIMPMWFLYTVSAMTKWIRGRSSASLAPMPR
jgi:aryl-alcohol dehydrogenase-like predicted oxidoreductase